MDADELEDLIEDELEGELEEDFIELLLLSRTELLELTIELELERGMLLLDELLELLKQSI